MSTPATALAACSSEPTRPTVILRRRRRLVSGLVAVAALLALSPGAGFGGTAEEAEQVLEAAGVTGGLVVHLGCGDGKLTAALHANQGFLVQGLDSDPEHVLAARRHIRDLGLYGPVSVRHLPHSRLPYADRLVNLVVAEDPGDIPVAEILRTLAPRGVLMRRRGEGWDRTVKPWPNQIDEWGHFLHGPDNNAVARDTMIGPSGRIQWEVGPRWTREHDVTPSVFAPVSAAGRLFYALEHGPVGIIDERLPESYSLVARDAFNGVTLWRRPMEGWYSTRVIWGHIPVHTQRRLVATEDRVYVTLGLQSPVTALDAATGEVVRTYDGTDGTSEIVVDGGILTLVIRREEPTGGLLAGRDRRRFRQGFTGPEGGAEAVVAVDADSGKTLWRDDRPCLPLTLASSHGHLFFVENDHVVCLEARSGTQRWRAPCPARSLLVHEDVVVVATDRGTSAYHKASKTVEIVAFSAAEGTRLWSVKGDCLPNFVFFYHPVDIYVARGQVWGVAENLEWNAKPGTGNLLGLDLKTGEVRTRISLEGAFTPGHHVRCYRGKATENFLLFNKRGIEFVDITSGGNSIQQSWIRGACRYGILPANGLIYTPPHACACYPGAKLDGFFALATADEGAATDGPPVGATGELETGPAYVPPDALALERSEPPKPHAGDWPTYRHDARRTGTSQSPVPPDCQPLWQTDIGGKLSAPVAAEGRVYVAAVDAHTIHCLAADDGREHWSFTAGGRVDSPPTIFGQLILFGCRDGWAYCLEASSGQLAYRFRPAPHERLIGAFGQLESAWPLHGSVLVKDNLAYLVAGRSSFVDGGIHVCAVDAASGKERFRTVLAGPDVNDASIPKSSGRMPGAVPDILSAGGESVFMRHVQLSSDLASPMTAESLSWSLKSQNQVMAGSGFLDDSLFNRTFWRYGSRIDRSQMLAVDGTDVYGLRVYSGISWNCSVYQVGDGHLLFRQDVRKPAPKAPQERTKMLNRIPYERYAWHTRVPARIFAMVVAGVRRADGAEKCLFAAGAPDEIDRNDLLATFEGRQGALLFALSGETGEVLAKQPLAAPPVWDGMIACRRRLYVSLQNGTLLCLGKDPR